MASMVTLLVLLSLPLSLSSCPDSDTSFQLVTGRVFRHPQAIIHTQVRLGLIWLGQMHP